MSRMLPGRRVLVLRVGVVGRVCIGLPFLVYAGRAVHACGRADFFFQKKSVILFSLIFFLNPKVKSRIYRFDKFHI